jgi:hypothetical protein
MKTLPCVSRENAKPLLTNSMEIDVHKWRPTDVHQNKQLQHRNGAKKQL